MNKKYFSTLLPPPNVTGVLHLGHVWNATIQDALIKLYKLEKRETYWGYGFDHAGLSLQIKFEQDLKKENINPKDLTEQEYFSKINNWKDLNVQKIKEQFKLINLSIPYSEENYTFDEFSIDFVLEKFVQLYEEGLIYESFKLINWDSKLQTAISDIEVSYKQQKGEIYYLKYFFENKKDFIWVATTRIETIFADVAVFVNDKDEKYKEFVGRKVFVPIINKLIPIMEDASVACDFGSGFMKCSPGHDFLDWELGIKYQLPVLQAFDKDLKMTKLAGEYKGLGKDVCKKLIIEKLLVSEELKIEKHINNIPYSERSGAIIEALISKQWFLKSSLLAKSVREQMLKNTEEINFCHKNYFEKCMNYFDNMKDWCISRQIKWGIRLPVFKNKTTKEFIVSLTNPGDEYEQITDVLDTWFSSSLWPLIVFNKKKNKKLESFYPVDFLASGRDILFFWICKMIFMSWHFEKKIPFKNIYLHGLILNKDNKKMSKSLNNGVTPEELIKKYSDNVIRLFLLLNTIEDNDLKYIESKLDYPNRFVHKLNNAATFFLLKDLIGNSSEFDPEQLFKQSFYGHVRTRNERKITISFNDKEYAWFFKFLSIIRHTYNILKLNRKETVLLNVVVSGSTEEFINKYKDVFHYFKIMNQKINAITNTRSSEETLVFIVEDLIFEVFLNKEHISEYKKLIQDKIEKLEFEVLRSKNILSNKDFVDNAKQTIVEDEKNKQSKYIKELAFYKELNNKN